MLDVPLGFAVVHHHSNGKDEIQSELEDFQSRTSHDGQTTTTKRRVDGGRVQSSGEARRLFTTKQATIVLIDARRPTSMTLINRSILP